MRRLTFLLGCFPWAFCLLCLPLLNFVLTAPVTPSTTPGTVFRTPVSIKRGTPTAQPTANPSATPVPRGDPAEHTLQALRRARPPLHDPVRFVHTVLHKPVSWTGTPAAPPRRGDRATFYILNHDTQKAHPIQARLHYITEHAYFWAEEGLALRQQDVAALMEAFESRIYPAMHRYFGSEPSPGIDGDPRIYILYVRHLGGGVAGYFASSDAWPRAVHPYSNQHEMFVFAADAAPLDDPWTLSLLAHEFQHMIHWAQDRNEATWINEGASELAPYLLGLEQDGREYTFLLHPDIALNAWPDPQQESTLPHYAASFLFLLYFWERFGDAALRELIAHPANGWDGIQAVLDRYAPGRTYEDIFLDWLVALVLNEPNYAEGLYGYRTYDLPLTVHTRALGCHEDRQEDVAAFGLDAFRLRCRGSVHLEVEVPETVRLLPTAPHSGRWMFWSNYGDESEMTLTRKFDLSRVQAPVRLSYWTWFDLEKDYDYVYILASRDGRTWDMLRPPSATERNPTGNNYGWGYTGTSGGQETPRWIRESVDLSRYVGGPVWVRFVYVTDAAVNHHGFLVDDIRLEALDYATDFEQDDGGWQARGFVRVTPFLPNAFRVVVVRKGPQGIQVQTFPLGYGRPRLSLLLKREPEERVWLLFTHVTRYTRERIEYRIRISP